MTDRTPRIMAFASAILLWVLGYVAVTTFYGKYFDVMASRGVHSPQVYEERLKRALHFDPTNGYVALKLARVAMRQGADGLALNYQREGMKSFSSVRSYGQLGSILMRKTFDREAAETFERAVRMNPNYIEAWEQLGILALRAGESQNLQQVTEEIRRRDLRNLNVYYLRAKDAERRGDTNGALLNYQIISAELARRNKMPERPMFSRDEIQSRIKQLLEERDGRQ
ncbi:MAG: tetratricopeptide repeat protein [Candidatus Sumerlaeaceae bacterium]